MRSLLFQSLVTLALAAGVAGAQPAASGLPQAETAFAAVDVWPEGKMPGAGAKEPEALRSPEKTDAKRITNISRPTLTVFPSPKTGGRLSPAMIVCPGGGYGYVVYDKEGTEIAAWLNTNGITALVLKYRVPHNREGALQDVQRALSMARARGGEWNVDPKRLGIIGFSAGGHLSAKASMCFGQRTYQDVDATDKFSCRPDFAVLIYPAYLASRQREGQLAPDVSVRADMPPTLIVHNEDDMTFVAGSKIYHAALDVAHVPNTFMLYPTGGHGYGLRCTRDARAWPEAALAWLSEMGVR